MSRRNVYIVNNISEGGAIKSFTELLINSIKKFNCEEINVLNNQNNFQNNIVYKNIFKIYNKFINKFLYRYNVKMKIRFIRNLDINTILIVPYVIQNQSRELDLFYEEIAKKKFVLVIHDLHIFNFPDKWDEVTIDHVNMRYFNLLASTSKVIVHNEFTRTDVLNKFNYDSKKIAKIWLPPFINTEKSYNYKRQKISFKFIDEIYAIWPSSSTSFHKNHDNLIKAWQILINKGVKINLVFTGNTSPRFQELNEMILELNLQKYIFFTGVISKKDLTYLISKAKFTICPTLFEGGGPVPAAESLLLKTPVLLSNITQCQELMNDRLNSEYFFDPLDPQDISSRIESLLENYGVALSYFDAFSNYYKNSRTWKKTSEQYCNELKLIN